MNQYKELIEDVLVNGRPKQGAQAVKKYSVLARSAHYNLDDGFPLLTTRDMKGSWKAMRAELLWIISGSTNNNDLHNLGAHLWDQWDTPETSGNLGYPPGEFGPIYGHQLRNFNGHVDQLAQTIDMLKRNPNTGRAFISYWNLEDVEINGQEKVFIAPCIAALHLVHQDGELSLHLIQRSADLAVGVPFDLAEYSLFLMLMAKELHMKPKEIVHTMSDLHIYEDQIPYMKEILLRKPNRLPTVTIDDSPSGTIYDHRLEDFHLNDYHPHPPIKGIPVAI